jgi:hypothetical protein
VVVIGVSFQSVTDAPKRPVVGGFGQFQRPSMTAAPRVRSPNATHQSTWSFDARDSVGVVWTVGVESVMVLPVGE